MQTMTFKLYLLEVIKHKIEGQSVNFHIYRVQKKITRVQKEIK